MLAYQSQQLPAPCTSQQAGYESEENPLQHGATLAAPLFVGKRDCSCIAIVHQIINTATGEARFHEIYYKIFQHIKNRIRKCLVYSTFQKFADGHEEEEVAPRVPN